MRWLPNDIGQSVCISMALLGAALTIHGQTTSSLRGTVVDPQGAAIPQALITLTNDGTGSARETLTDATGVYQFVQMAPGDYTVTAVKTGFSMLTRKGVKLLVNTPATADLKMDVGKTTETVNVSAEALTINTVDASVGNTFNQTQIRQLPLDTRNIVELLSLQPGVTSTGEVMGSRRDQNNVTLDGVDVNDNENAGIGGVSDIGSTQGSNANGVANVGGFNSVLPIPLDSVQEFRVTVAGQGADEGRSSGGQVVLVTKSGTNNLHGSAYEYNRNTLFAANSWFNNRSGVDRQVLNRNQFGASLGGPVKKDRFFYFFNYERRIDASQLAVERAVPSESLKAGNLVLQDANGNNYTLTPAQIQQIDPLHIGVNQGYLNILKQYPVGNDPAYGADGGLAFTGYRFNAPDKLDNRAYVGKIDFLISSRQTLSLRGTLSNADQDNPSYLAQFPGQAPASVLLNNSKGLAANYSFVVRANLINSLVYGYTRQGAEQSGISGASFGLLDIDPLQNYNARAASRILPVNNIADNLTWIKSKHSISSGINFRLMTNNRSSYANSYPSYGFSTTVAVGLGEDIQNDVTNFMAAQTGNANFQLANPDAVATAMGTLLGLVNNTQITYQFDHNGNPLPIGAPSVRAFDMKEYEGYVNDSWRVTPELTITFGLRYSNDRPPFEANGLQVAPNIGLDQYFAQRVALGAEGVPSNAMPNAYLSYSLGGPVNGKPSWYEPDNNNFGPRFALAYSPRRDGWLRRVFGSNGAFRMGGAMLYDRYGSELITQYNQFGSFGLATTLNNPVSYNFSDSPRSDGQLPQFPASPAGGFPYTPPDVNAISGEFQGIYPNLKSPYSMLLNASFAREIPGKLSLEVSYNGRLSRKLLLQGDVYTPLENFKDPGSGETWVQAMTQFRLLNDSGLTPNGVMSNPSLVPNIPFVQDLFPALANYYFPGSASANYFYGIYGVYGGSYLDILHALDRVPGAFGTPNGTCASLYGCFTFFAPQGSSMPTWMNAGNANFHALTVTLRRGFTAGWSFDLNYTWSHSIDNASAAEGAAGQDGAVIQNIFNQGQFRGSSDFDIRQQLNANVVYELPFGKGKHFAHNISSWANQIIGGWQVSSIARLSSGLPTVIQGNYTWNTNYWQNSLAIPAGGLTRHIGYDELDNPSLFSNTSAVNSFADQFPGQTGTRAILRLAPMTNVDLAIAKSFPLPWEGHRIQFRAEAYNAFNTVNFTNPSLALYNPSTFGEFQSTTPPREMQFALRYEF